MERGAWSVVCVNERCDEGIRSVSGGIANDEKGQPPPFSRFPILYAQLTCTSNNIINTNTEHAPGNNARLFYESLLQHHSKIFKVQSSPHSILSQPSTANRLAFVSDDRQRSSARKRAPNNEFILQHLSKAAAH